MNTLPRRPKKGNIHEEFVRGIPRVSDRMNKPLKRLEKRTKNLEQRTAELERHQRKGDADVADLIERIAILEREVHHLANQIADQDGRPPHRPERVIYV